MNPIPLAPDILQTIEATMLRVASMTHEMQSQLDKTNAWRKSDHTHITIADLAGQIVLLGMLQSLVPGERIFAEEDASSLKKERRAGLVRDVVEQLEGRSFSLKELHEIISYRGNAVSERSWLLDPIDGTKGYVHGTGYAVALATLEHAAVTRSWMAVPGDPAMVPGVTDHLFVAARGEGVTRIRISDPDSRAELDPPAGQPLDGGRLVITASRAAKNVDLPPTVDTIRWNIDLLSLDSLAKYAALATGAAHLYPRKPSRWIGPFHTWDHAAGVLLVEETGGICTDLAGKSLDWSDGNRLYNNRGIFAASHPDLHKHFQPLFADHVRGML